MVKGYHLLYFSSEEKPIGSNPSFPILCGEMGCQTDNVIHKLHAKRISYIWVAVTLG